MPHKKRGHGHHKHTKEEKEVGVFSFTLQLHERLQLITSKTNAVDASFICTIFSSTQLEADALVFLAGCCFFTDWFQFLRIVDQSIHQLFPQGRITYSVCQGPSWTCVRVPVCALMGCVDWSGQCLCARKEKECRRTERNRSDFTVIWVTGILTGRFEVIIIWWCVRACVCVCAGSGTVGRRCENAPACAVRTGERVGAGFTNLHSRPERFLCVLSLPIHHGVLCVLGTSCEYMFAFLALFLFSLPLRQFSGEGSSVNLAPDVTQPVRSFFSFCFYCSNARLRARRALKNLAPAAHLTGSKMK